MASRRTQIYLTAEQRRRIDARRRRDHRSLADLVREALERYLADADSDPDQALAATYGRMPNLKIPSRDDWDRG